MSSSTTQHALASSGAARARRMVRSTLMGGHTHTTQCGIFVHIWTRNGKFLARGYYLGQRFGETLGSDETTATSRLRHLLTEIENGSYVRPSEARQRPLSSRKVPRLTLRQLADEFLAEKRKLRGQRTAATYMARLRPVLDFAEQATARRRWPLALNIDRDFAIELRGFLHQSLTTRNGRPGAKPKPMSARQIINVLECLRSMLCWARRAEIRRLPADWRNPLTPEIVGNPLQKDPLRENLLALQDLVGLVATMDRWQLCQLAWCFVLPLRPEQAAGLLVDDVDWTKGWFNFGARMGGGDFTKGRTTFKMPFPADLVPLLMRCIDGRTAGPLLRNRRAFENSAGTKPIGTGNDLTQLFHDQLAKATRGGVLTEQDRKGVFRSLLVKLGGVSTDRLAAEFKQLARTLDPAKTVSVGALRHCVTTWMKQADLPHLELRYLTAHTTNDILNEYVTLDPVAAMQKYFSTIRPLLDAIRRRGAALGLVAAPAEDSSIRGLSLLPSPE